MNIITDRDFPLKQKTAVSIGNFDGVHIGHRLLIKTLASESARRGVPGIVFTFGENPKNILTGGVVKYLTGTGDKMGFLAEYGASGVYFADFEEMCGLTPEDFVAEVLIGRLNAELVVCGYDFRFGKDRSGDAETLAALLAQRGADCVIAPPVYVDDLPVSSTEIRRLIAAGDLEKAEKLLGRPYVFTLPVVHGRQIGRALGFPTINQVFPEYRVIPACGVYAVFCEESGEEYRGIANIGIRPTFERESEGVVCETNLFGFSGDLYDRTVRVKLKKRLRPELKFSSIEELKEQIYKDIEEAEAYFARLGEGGRD